MIKSSIREENCSTTRAVIFPSQSKTKSVLETVGDRGQCHDRSFFQRWDDWMWYQDHLIFKKQACMQSVLFSGEEEQPQLLPKFFRFSCLLILTANLGYTFHNHIAHGGLKDIMQSTIFFLASWGYFSVMSTFLFGTYMSFCRKYNGQGMNVMVKGTRYDFWQAWKWFIISFEQSIMNWFLISCIFWFHLWPMFKKTPEYQKNEQMKYEILSAFILPPLCLLIDYVMNAVPIAKRHAPIVVLVSISQLLFNAITIQIITGESLKDITQFETSHWFLFVQGASVAGLAWFYLIYFINYMKLSFFAKVRTQEFEMLMTLRM